MFRKTILSAMAVVVLATSAFSVSATEASAGSREGRIVAGTILGTAALILGAAHAQNSYHDGRHGGYHGKRRHASCVDRPIRRYDPYYGHKVVVGYRTVCR